MDAKTSFTTMGTPDLDHRGAIALAEAYNFQGVDIRCSDHKGELHPTSTADEIAAIRDDFAAASLSIPGLLCYNKISNEISSGRWSDFESDMSLILRIGRDIGADSVRIFGGKNAEGESIEEYIDLMTGALHKALAEDDSNVDIVIQNHDGSLDARQCTRLAKQVNSPRFGVVFSPDHTLLQPEDDFDGLLQELLPWCKEIYIADMAKKDDENISVLPGQGDVPLKETIDFFSSNGFDGFYSFKWEKLWVDSLPKMREAIPSFVEYMKTSSSS